MPAAEHVIESVQTNFRSIKNAPKTLKILQSGRGGAREWQATWTLLYGSVMIRDALLSLTSRRGVGIVDKVRRTLRREPRLTRASCSSMSTRLRSRTWGT